MLDIIVASGPQVAAPGRIASRRTQSHGAINATIAPLVLIALFVGAARASAQTPAVGSRFPSVARVRADYPDDAERFIAFDILFRQLGEATRGTQSRTNYELANAYFSARGEILAAYEQQGNGSEAYKTFTARTGSLFSDPEFTRSLLDRYQLANVPATGQATSNGSFFNDLLPERPGDRSD